MSTFPVERSPQDYLNELLRSRGYSTQTYPSLSNGYFSKPSPLQIASYGIELIKAVNKSDSVLLERFLRLGLSPNACNKFGESLLHSACRKASKSCLKTLMEYNCSVQICDDCGRTPLHDVCWTTEPCFESATMLLDADHRMIFMTDRLGVQPFAYIPKENWAKWIEFLDRKKDIYWATRNVLVDGDEPPPELTLMKPGEIRVPNPPNACTPESTMKLFQALKEKTDGAKITDLRIKKLLDYLSCIKPASQ